MIFPCRQEIINALIDIKIGYNTQEFLRFSSEMNCLIITEERVFNDPSFCCLLLYDWILLDIPKNVSR